MQLGAALSQGYPPPVLIDLSSSLGDGPIKDASGNARDLSLGVGDGQLDQG